MPTHDVIVVGSRISGSTLTSSLATSNLRVLLLDRARRAKHIHRQGSIGRDVARQWSALKILPVIESLGAPRIRAQDVSTAGVRVHYAFPPCEHCWRMTVRRGRLDGALAAFA